MGNDSQAEGGGRANEEDTGWAKQNMVGPRIKQLRLEKGMTQKTLAERLETLAVYVCRGSISRIEEQKRTITDIELAGIAEVLQVDISEFFKKDE